MNKNTELRLVVVFLEYGVGSEKDEFKWKETRALWKSHVWNGKHFEGFRSNTRCSNLFNPNSNELTLSRPIKVKKVSAPVELANSPTLLYQRPSNGEATESSTRSGDSIYGRNNEYAGNQRRQPHVSGRSYQMLSGSQDAVSCYQESRATCTHTRWCILLTFLTRRPETGALVSPSIAVWFHKLCMFYILENILERFSCFYSL